MTDLDLQLSIDSIVQQLKEQGMTPEKIYEVVMFEVSRACEEQFPEDENVT